MPQPKISGFKTLAQKAEELGVTERTLQSWRTKRIGPPWAKIARTIIYPDDDGGWLRSQVVQPVRSRRAA